ncbi:MAG: Rpn family recombination-promoting nuclease/putative transposase [Chitinophagales bacterium]
MAEIFVNPFTDFGFKKLFGEEVNKELLIDFLNELLPLKEHKIANLTYLKNEHLSNHEEDRRAIFDLYCESDRGDKFIVEIQRAKQKFFKDRSIYYATFPIQEQAKTGKKWDFELKAVYTVAIMDFEFENGRRKRKDASPYLHKIQLMDTDRQTVFYKKLTFIYLEMPRFKKEEHELKTHFDKWLYILKNLHKLQSRSPSLQERIFQKLFDVAEIAKFAPKERMAYHEALKNYRDFINVVDTAIEDREIKMVRGLLKEGLDEQAIARVTGWTIDTIQEFKKKN